jgi:lysophospholipase L1-like esterase
MKPIYIILISLFGLMIIFAITMVIYYKLTIRKIFTLPSNNPNEFLIKNKDKKKLKKRIVFVGDSLTHANLSFSYIDLIKKKLGEDNFEYINAGINAEIAYNVLMRLDSIIACEPDIITILIGTNNSNREYDNKVDKRSAKRLNLPKFPDMDWFIENYNKILTTLEKETNAKIAICSIPVAGEHFDHPVFKTAIKYSNVIKGLAKKYDVNYLPINEKMMEYLEEHPSNPKYNFDKWLVDNAAILRIALKKDFDEISEKYGFALLTDHIHLNSKGAKIIADLMIDFIEKVDSK